MSKGKRAMIFLRGNFFFTILLWTLCTIFFRKKSFIFALYDGTLFMSVYSLFNASLKLTSAVSFLGDEFGWAVGS